jgi:hypothetical protein
MNSGAIFTLRPWVQRGLSLSTLGVALLAVAGTAMGQSNLPRGTARPAEYACSGLEGVALTSCRQLNEAAIQGASIKSNSSVSPTHDCAGMSGGALATCRDLNGQPAMPDGGSANSGSSLSSATGTTMPDGTALNQSPVPQRTTGNSPSITSPGAAGAANGLNDGIALQPPGMQAPATSGLLRDPVTSPGNGQVSRPTDRIVPLNSAAPPKGAGTTSTAGAGGKAGK